jgi:hypothetical protein
MPWHGSAASTSELVLAIGVSFFALAVGYASKCIRAVGLQLNTVHGAFPAKETTKMNLAVWLPALFALGLFSIVVCLAFAEGCAGI